jgi:hypothetical protein
VFRFLAQAWLSSSTFTTASLLYISFSVFLSLRDFNWAAGEYSINRI